MNNNNPENIRSQKIESNSASKNGPIDKVDNNPVLSKNFQIISTLKHILPDLPLSQSITFQDYSTINSSTNEDSILSLSSRPKFSSSSSTVSSLTTSTFSQQRVKKKPAVKRIKRKSKYTKDEDNLIVSLKRSGYNWTKIATIMNMKSPIAVRNRYQVLMGQQGSSISLNNWTDSEVSGLKELLDISELVKWEAITTELQKVTNKNFSIHQVFMVCKMLLKDDPNTFGISGNIVKNMQEFYDEMMRNTAKKLDLEHQKRSPQQTIKSESNTVDRFPPPSMSTSIMDRPSSLSYYHQQKDQKHSQ